jgi:hypothetical protein
MKVAETCAGAVIAVLSVPFLLVGAVIGLFDLPRYLRMRRM